VSPVQRATRATVRAVFWTGLYAGAVYALGVFVQWSWTVLP